MNGILKKLRSVKIGVILYGALIGLILIIIQIIKSHVLINELKIELFGMIVAICSVAIGLWAGFVWKRKPRLAKPTDSTLSQREIEVLQLLADGYSNQEISDRLFVSLNTTKTHLSKIYQKLAVKRRTQAVQKALELGILEMESENHPKV